MRYPRPADTELMTAIDRFVKCGAGHARYMDLLHGNFLRLGAEERAGFGASLAEAAAVITDHELEVLLASEWRSRLTASWLIAVDRRTQFRDRLRDLLLASEVCFAGQGHIFAFTRFGESRDAGVLAEYLERYLPRLDCHYDQHWAIGALMNLDESLGTASAGALIAPGGLWERSAMKHLNPQDWKVRLAALSAFAEDCTARQ
jgi:hypothetical protein